MPIDKVVTENENENENKDSDIVKRIIPTIDNVVMENKDNFECLVIKPGKIDHLDWAESNYLSKLMELGLVESVTVNSDTFLKFISDKLETEKYKIKNLSVKNEIIGEEPYFLYELLYIDLEKELDYHKEDSLNNLANIVTINGDQIYSNAILVKNHLPSMTDSMTLCSVTKEDLKRVLHERIHTRVVTYDGENWKEEHVVGDLNLFAKDYFEGESFQKLELGFLMHNINIWYTTIYGTFRACGKVLDKPIDKCIWFTMKSEEYRGNLTLDEVKKIIKLSNSLDNFNTPKEYTDEKIDSFGRKIINNKYKVLDELYNKIN
jgi:hypothetical protein